MAPIHGKGTRVLVNGRDLSGILNMAGSSIGVDAADVTVFTSVAKDYQAGMPDGTMKFGGFQQVDTDPTGVIPTEQERLAAALGTKGVALVYPAGVDAAGSPGRACEYIQTTLDAESPVDGVMSLDIELQATGGVSPVVSLAPLAARTTTAPGSAVDSTIAGGTALGGMAYLEVTSAQVAGTTLVVKVQGSADGSTGWADLATFTTVNGATTFQGSAEAKSWAAGAAGSTPRYLRASWTVTGAGPSFTFTVAAFRRLVAA